MRARDRGISLIEVVIATGILIGIMAILSMAVQQNAKEAKFDLAGNEAGHASRSIVQQIGRELVDAGGDEFDNDYLTTHNYGTISFGSTVTFRKRTDIRPVTAANAGNNWSTPITYTLQGTAGETPGNGVDDDGDGMIDEQQLVRTQNGQTVVLDKNVIAFTVRRDDGSTPNEPGPEAIKVTVQIGRFYDINFNAGQRFISRTAETVVLVRNRPTAP